MTPMRTDVKIGLICAAAVVLCVVLFVATRGSGKPAVPAANNSGPALHPVAPAAPVATNDNPTPGPTDVFHAPGGPTPATPDPLAGGNATPGVPGMNGGTAAAGNGTPGTPTVPYLPNPANPTPANPNPIAGGVPTPTIILPNPAPTAATTYKIQKGDMLATIAHKNNVTLKALQDANPGIDSNHLKIGVEIKIPGTPAAVATPRTPTTPVTPNNIIPGRTSTPGTTTAVRTTTSTIRPGSTYVIKRNDTLATISKAAYGNASERAKIFQANRDKLDDPDTLPIGVTIKIP